MHPPQAQRLRDVLRCIAIPSFLYLSIVCLLVSATVGCGKQPTGNAPVPVKVTVLAPEEIVVSTRFSGSVEPLQSTDLAFKLPGTVKHLYQPPGLDRDVQVGDTLAKGTVIAELDEGDLRARQEAAPRRGLRN